jgi:hypothetical protein
MQSIPLQQTPSQTVKIILNGQNCTLAVYQKSTGVFCDLMIDSVIVWTCAICQNNTPICSYGYLPFVGSLLFFDTQGTSDPDYTGFDDRFVLLYLAPGEGVQQ